MWQMVDEQKYLEAILNGTFHIRRFTRKEQGGSSDPADRFLWLAILRAELELAGEEPYGICRSSPTSSRTSTSPCRFLSSLSDSLPPSFGKLVDELGQFRDRGRESVVFDAGDGFVYKLRKMVPSIFTGYIAPLANIVYHNAIFSRDRYVLESIYTDGNQYFMVLKQPMVEISLDDNGYPVKPNASMMRDAIRNLGIGLIEFVRSGIAQDDACDSDSTDSDEDSSEHLKFYNADYYISDLQPGRNVVIDANNGGVRFIDPRITLNDVDGPITPVSRFGMRKEDVPAMSFVL